MAMARCVLELSCVVLYSVFVGKITAIFTGDEKKDKDAHKEAHPAASPSTEEAKEKEPKEEKKDEHKEKEHKEKEHKEKEHKEEKKDGGVMGTLLCVRMRVRARACVRGVCCA